MNTHILLIESNTHLSQLLESDFRNAPDSDIGIALGGQRHYCLSVAHSGMEGLYYVRQAHPDLILISMNLPDLSGPDICRRLRSSGIQVPLILLGKGHEIQDCVAGLDAGANDYMFYPFAIEELRARIRSRLRRVAMDGQHNQLRFEELTLDRLTREVYRYQKAIELTAKEFALLEYFMVHPRQVMTRDQILDHIWQNNSDVESNVIDVYIRYLRMKLEQHHKQRLLHTVRSVGYVLREPTLNPVSAKKQSGVVFNSRLSLVN